MFADEETGKVNGWCYSCGTFVANPYGEEKTVADVELPKPKTQAEIDAEIAEIGSYQYMDTPSRKLRAEDWEEFDVKVAVSEEDGKTPTTTYFPMEHGGKVTGYYAKTLTSPSHTWSLGDTKNADLFGWAKARESGAYRLIIAEGREDAVAIKKIYKRYGKEDYMPAVVALPNGCQSTKRVLTHHKDEISRLFREVVICFDDDKVGQKAVTEAVLILPKAKSVVLPKKDANECVLRGVQKAAYKALAFDASPPKNTNLINARDLFQTAREPTPYGELRWPYPTMNKWLRNIRYGTTIYIGAGVKMGKSELVDDLAAFFITEEQVGVFMAKPEQSNKKTLKKVASKVAGINFDDPDVPFEYDAFDSACEKIGEKLWMVDLYQNLGWEALKADIIGAAGRGVKAVFIDPITNLTSGMDSGEANTKLQEIAVELSILAKDLNLVIFIFCHLKAPEGNISKDIRAKRYRDGNYIKLGNCPHELGGDVLSNQFAGSRAMMRSCDLMIGLEGNRDGELPEEIRNTRWLSILEDRDFGNNGSVRLFWNKNTTRFKEYNNG